MRYDLFKYMCRHYLTKCIAVRELFAEKNIGINEGPILNASMMFPWF